MSYNGRSLDFDGTRLKQWITDELGLTIEDVAESIFYHERSLSRAIYKNRISESMLYAIFERYDVSASDSIVSELLGDDFDYESIFR